MAWVPLALLLIAVCEASGMGVAVVHGAGSSLLLARALQVRAIL